jgi:membrane protein implicated in regulation of membrane protease activity
MSGGQVVALVFAILLLLPGGCFLFVGVAVLTDKQFADAAFIALPIAAVILGLSALLFWVAFQRRRDPDKPPVDIREP